MKGFSLFLLLTCVALPSYASSGILKVHESVEYKKLFGRKKTMQPGEYTTKVKLRRKKVKFKAKNSAGKHNIKLKIPANQLPRVGSGRFEIPATLTNQAFGAKGSVDRLTSTSAVQSRLEYCTISIPVRVCHRDRDSRRQVCRTVYRDIQGRRRVDYHIETTHEDLVVHLTKVEKIVATYTGKDISRRRVTDYYGACRYR